jgi:hypothetical protein
MAQSNDPGYFHRSIDNGKNPPIRPFEPWTSNKKEAMVLAQELANENGYPITVYWSGIMGGTLSKVGRVKPKAGNQGKRGNPTPRGKLLSTDKNGWEYWQLGQDVYRCKVGNRGYIAKQTGVPNNARWECSIEHYKRYLAPGGLLGNPDATPDDPREIAQDLRILKAKQKLVRLEGKQGNPKSRKGKRNPSSLSSSQSLVETFHGRSHNSVDDIVTFDSFPDSLAELGELRELVIISPHFKGKLPIGFDEEGKGVVKLASAPGGTQYVLVGGDQGIDPDSLVEDFGIPTDEIGDEWQRKVVLGEVVSLTYYTDKHHLSGPKYQKDGCLYEHQLGEEGGELPTLVYDPNNESMEIVGGSYITKEEGIRN